MFLVWEAAKALGKWPGEIWAAPRSEQLFILEGVKYDLEMKAKQGGVNLGG